MANSDKRTDRSTGKYDTVEELTTEVLRMHRTKKYSREYMGKLVGVSGATCTRIIHGNKPHGVQVDLGAMFNELWIITEKPEEDDDEDVTSSTATK